MVTASSGAASANRAVQQISALQEQPFIWRVSFRRPWQKIYVGPQCLVTGLMAIKTLGFLLHLNGMVLMLGLN